MVHDLFNYDAYVYQEKTWVRLENYRYKVFEGLAKPYTLGPDVKRLRAVRLS